MRLSFVGLLPIVGVLPPVLAWLKRWLLLFGEVGDTCGNDGDNAPPGDRFITEVGGRIVGPIEGDKCPIPIINAGGNCGNPGIPGTIPGGLGRKEEPGDGGNFALFVFCIEEDEGVMTAEDKEDNPEN